MYSPLSDSLNQLFHDAVVGKLGDRGDGFGNAFDGELFRLLGGVGAGAKAVFDPAQPLDVLVQKSLDSSSSVFAKGDVGMSAPHRSESVEKDDFVFQLVPGLRLFRGKFQELVS